MHTVFRWSHPSMVWHVDVSDKQSMLLLASLLMFRLSKWRWTGEARTWSEPKGASPEGWGALQGRAFPIARGWHACGRAVPGLATQRRGGESQRAATHTVPHCGEDDKRPHYEVVTQYLRYQVISWQQNFIFAPVFFNKRCQQNRPNISATSERRIVGELNRII